MDRDIMPVNVVELAKQMNQMRGSIKALQDEVAQLNRRLLELSLNASVRLGETK